MSEAIELDAPDDAWPAAFAAEKALIAPLFTVAPRLIEHMGSTAVPGLGAKPVIDIIVLMDRLADARPAIPALEATGYRFWAANPDASRLFLAKGLPPAPRRTHHLHVYDDAEEVQRHLLFRDHLRANPPVRDAYWRLKRELAAQYKHDREAYTAHKNGFVDGVIERLGGPPRKW